MKVCEFYHWRIYAGKSTTRSLKKIKINLINIDNIVFYNNTSSVDK